MNSLQATKFADFKFDEENFEFVDQTGLTKPDNFKQKLTVKDFDFEHNHLRQTDGVELLCDEFESYSTDKLEWFARHLEVPDWKSRTSQSELIDLINKHIDSPNPTDYITKPYNPELPTIYCFRSEMEFIAKCNNGNIHYFALFDRGCNLSDASYRYPELTFYYQFGAGERLLSRQVFTDRFWFYENYYDNKVSYRYYLVETRQNISRRSFLEKFKEISSYLLEFLFPANLAELAVDYLYPFRFEAKDISWPGLRSTG